MFWWVFIPIYVTGGLLCGRYFLNWLYNNDSMDGAPATVFVVAGWPFVLAGWLAWQIIKPNGLREEEREKKLKAKKLELKKQELEIEKLKKEYGL